MSSPMMETPLVADLGGGTGEDLSAFRVGVVTFPGTLDDRDAARAVRLAGGTPVPLWYADAHLSDVDAVIIPGGFSYGDYLRAGAISRFAPLMGEIVRAAGSDAALPVLGICNGFQILTEAHLLPGSMIRNRGLKFICRDQRLRVENSRTSWTSDFHQGQEIVVPLKNNDGQYVCDRPTLDMLEAEGLVAFRYAGAAQDGDDAANPNGSLNDIAGITNPRGNVVGLMPHPEHAVEPGFGPSSSASREVPMGGGTDGLGIFASVLHGLAHPTRPRPARQDSTGQTADQQATTQGESRA